MKIMIDIDDELYEQITVKKEYYLEDGEDLCSAIENGTPLPKGHGRLIDAREYENSIRKHYFDNKTVIRCTEIALNNAPTIVESDEGENK